MTTLYQNQQIRQIENLVYESGLASEFELMQLAGSAAFNEFKKNFPEKIKVLICCGKGNNAGDGLIFAALAHQSGYQVTLSLAFPSDQFSPCAAQAYVKCQSLNLKVQAYQPEQLLETDVVIDALLGIGLVDAVRQPIAAIITAINEADAPVISIDVPSGLNSDTGDDNGQAVKAELTITMIGLKQGLYTAKAASYCGQIVLSHLNIPHKIYQQVEPSAKLLEWQNLQPLLPKRERDAHKGDCGHVLIIGGDYGMGGAVRMSAEAALRSGAGLVTVATRPEHLNVVSGARPEIMCCEVSSEEDLEPLLERCNVVVIGPGLGKSDWAKSLLNKVLSSYHKMVLDADALNLLSQLPDQQADDWVLTPHPGEAARLLDCSTAEIQEDRFLAARELITRYHGVTVLKGSGTIVAAPDQLPHICTAGNPGMASAGMGDILSGVVGGLIAQGLRCYTAASVGVAVHSMAADKASQEGGERGLLATDLLRFIREMVNTGAD